MLPGGAIRGIVEGFYGTPWSWDDRVDVGRYCAARGMTHFVYKPHWPGLPHADAMAQLEEFGTTVVPELQS